MIPRFRPIIPERQPEIFEHPDWLYELKYDGFRALAYIDAGVCKFVSKKGNDLKRFDDLCSALPKEVKARSAVLDGEVVALDQRTGKPAFYRLMKRDRQAVYFAFDLLWLDGADLRELPLIERKKILRSVIPKKSVWVGYVSHIERNGRIFELIKAHDLEGLVVKRKDGKYNPQTTRWFKVINPLYSQKAGRQEFFQRN